MAPCSTRPGGCTSPRIENAVSDLPLPDSPTSDSVSPLRSWKLTSMTAGTKRPAISKPVVRCSTVRTGSDIDLLVLAEDASQRVRTLAHGREGFDGRDDRRHQVRVAARRGDDRVHRRLPGGGVALRPDRGHAFALLPLEFGIDAQHFNRCALGRLKAVHADDNG